MSNEWSLANIDVRKIKSDQLPLLTKIHVNNLDEEVTNVHCMIIRHAEDSEILVNHQMAYNEINCWRWWCKKLRSVLCTDIYK